MVQLKTTQRTNLRSGSDKEEILMRDIVMELWAFMKERKKFWLLPIILVLVFLGSLIVLIQVSPHAPIQDVHQGESAIGR
jgi:Family of unknown function (DUF5989)